MTDGPEPSSGCDVPHERAVAAALAAADAVLTELGRRPMAVDPVPDRSALEAAAEELRGGRSQGRVVAASWRNTVADWLARLAAEAETASGGDSLCARVDDIGGF